MAQRPLLLLTAVDVRRATETGTSSAIILSKLTIPPVKLKKAPHDPGGGVMEVDFTQPRIEKLEPAFSVKGLDTDIFRGYGETDRWTFAGAYKDKQSGRMLAGRGIIEGSVTDWEPDESDPAEFQGCNHMYSEVTHFEFLLDGIELLYFDFWERVARFKGNDLFGPVRTALGA